MGASGAGKTTLLNALSGRIKIGEDAILTGDRKLNNHMDLTKDTFSKFGAYVMQDDSLFEYFTVIEALRFAAKLKLNVSFEEREKRVADIIAELGLTEC